MLITPSSFFHNFLHQVLLWSHRFCVAVLAIKPMGRWNSRCKEEAQDSVAHSSLLSKYGASGQHLLTVTLAHPLPQQTNALWNSCTIQEFVQQHYRHLPESKTNIENTRQVVYTCPLLVLPIPDNAWDHNVLQDPRHRWCPFFQQVRGAAVRYGASVANDCVTILGHVYIVAQKADVPVS